MREPAVEIHVSDAQGDGAAFRRLYPRLRQFAGAVCSLDADPDDLVQDALLQVLRRGGLAGLNDPERYLRRTIVNLEANHRRRQARGRHAQARLTRDVDEVPAYPSDLVVLDQIAPRDRALLFLTDIEGFSFRQAAVELGGTEVSLRLRASRARRRLRAYMETGETS